MIVPRSAHLTGMSETDKYGDDEYVARLLAEDAKKSSMRYASVGLAALLPRRQTGSAPRPNTKFLKNLVRDADSHNAALRKKEELETKIRLREIREQERERHRLHPDRRTSKRRRLSHEEDADDRHRSRHKHSRRSVSPASRRSRDGSRDQGRDDKKRHRDAESVRKRSLSEERDMRDGRKHRVDYEIEPRSERHRSSRSHRPSHRRRSASSDRQSRDGKQRVESKRSDSTRHTSSRSHTERKSSRRSPQGSSKHAGTKTNSDLDSESDSDPLESIVGPLPNASSKASSKKAPPPKQPHVRGRGALNRGSTTTNIDTHFSPTYDPSKDTTRTPSPISSGPVRMETNSDWDMALEALRDRNMWKRKQADRMREAGWTEDEIGKWKRGAFPQDREGDGKDGGEPGTGAVVWKKRGEMREWDKGKDMP